MPHDWLPDKRTYESDGRLVPRAEVRREVERLIEHVQDEAAKIAERFRSGAIDITEFEAAMRELLRAGHIVTASVGRGGRAQMDAADWGRVGQSIKRQYDYLAKFARKIATGKLEKPYTANRARSYASSLYVSYSNGRAAAEEEFIANNGGREGGDGPKIQVRLVQNSQEGCVECTADAAEGWMDVEEMTEIGGRICGDFCLCEIEFSDEIDE